LSEAAVFDASTTRAEALVRLAEIFQASGVENPVREARIVLRAVCALSPEDLIVAVEEPLGADAGELTVFAARRAAGEPLSRIVGRREFWGLTLSISPQVLDPRRETETIVETAARLFRYRRLDALRILDLGVGSGALLCALLVEFANGRGLGVDVCAAAANIARDNIQTCGLAGRAEIRAGNWTHDLEGPFDLIVSNPPYVPSSEIVRLPREVRDFDPWIALDGGFDGLTAYRAIVPSSARLLAAEGWLLIEIAAGRMSEVCAIVRTAGFQHCVTYKDLAGIERVVAARSPQAPLDRRNREEGNRRDRFAVLS
jgi:release factor glutamine methyltransferase